MNGSSSTVIRVSHFTFVMPYQPGTTSRSGKPCWGGSGAPFISKASSPSSASAIGSERSYHCGTPPSTPRSSAVKSTSIAPGAGPASSSSGRSAAPAHSAVPTASVSHGWLTGRGSSSARPLPAHSNVIGSATRSRARRSSSDSDSDRSTAPPTSSRKPAGSTSGMS